MNLRTILGLLIGLAAGAAAAPLLVNRLQREPQFDEDGMLPLDLDLARRMFRDDASMEESLEEMMKYFESEFPGKDDR